MESLMAAAILFAGVLAIVTAVSAGQKKAFEAEIQVAAVLVAEDLMGQITAGGYDAIAAGYWAFESDVVDTPLGELEYTVFSLPSDKSLAGLGILIHGYDVTTYVSEKSTGRQLLQMNRFVPEPGS